MPEAVVIPAGGGGEAGQPLHQPASQLIDGLQGILQALVLLLPEEIKVPGKYRYRPVVINWFNI